MLSTDFNQLILTALGGNLVDVELTAADYAFAFANAKRVWIQYGNSNTNEQYIPLSVIKGTQTYDMSNSPAQIDTVLNIVRSGSGFYTSDPFSVATFNELFQGLYTGYTIDLLSLEEIYELIEELKIYTVFDPEFIWNKRTQQLRFLKTPQIDDTTFVHAYCYETDENMRDMIWIQQWAIAECKVILGTAYKKFSQVSGPAGEIQLNGDSLITDGRQMMTDLRKSIDDYTDGDPAGGYIYMG
jgi:hypothetical protein